MTTWNPSDKHADLVLSNGNLTVTFVDPAGFKNARSSTGKGSGKWYFEVLFGGSLGNCGVGVANASASLSNYLGSDSNSRGWYHTGFGGHTTFTSGDVIGVAIDADTRTLWFSKNGTFNGDPAAGTGGISLSVTGDLYAAFSEQFSTGAGTIRPDAAAQDYSAPTGFSAWDAPASGSTGTLSATEAADTASFAGAVPIAGTLAATEAADTALFSSQETAPQRNTLLLAFGQSNNIATGTTPANMLADGTSTPAEITAITATGKVKSGYPVDATFTVSDYDPADSEPDYSVHTWGPEAGFAAAWLEEQTHPDSRLMIIKRSADSSNLGQWLPGQDAWIWVEWLIDGALAWAASNSIEWDDLVVLMVNCESEGTNETLADACESRLTTLCADLRDADNLGASAKIVMTRLPDVSASYAYLSTVRTAQETVAAASADNYLIDTDDLLPLRDAYHWMAPDVAEIGARAYAAALGEEEAEPVTGTLAATEGADSASFAGSVAVQGTFDASEGADTAAIEGTVLVSGAVAASEGADTAAFEGAVAVAGSLAASEAPDTVAMAGTVLIQGSLAATEASDTAAFSGSQVLTGTLAATEASDSASFSGKVVVAGALAASEEVDSASFAGTVRIGGTLGATESADGAAFGGLVLIQGGLSATEGADTAAFTSRPYVASARRTASSLRPSRTRASPSTNRVAASQR